jgi:5'-3' exonuclease
MTNAVFDVSNMFYRSLFIVSGYKNSFTFDSQSELDQLMRKVSMDITQVIRQVNPSRALFTIDSKSWRKDISIDENDGYKAQRTKASHINWTNVYKIMDEFSSILKTQGFIVSKFDRAEADDLIALWKEELLKQDQHVIIVSADEDVRQLVDSVENNGKTYFSVVFNPFTQGKNASKRLFVPKNFAEWLKDTESGDIFDRSIDVDKEDLLKMAEDPKIRVEIVNGIDVVLYKIFCGDDGDNVPAIYTWLNDKGREVRITNSKYKEITENLGITNPWELPKKSDLIKEQLKIISGKEPSFTVSERIQRQMKLVLLDSKMFPTDIVSSFNKNAPEELGKPHIRPQSCNMVSLLEGTRYVSTDGSYKRNSGKESSIFGDLDKINKSKSLF